MSEASTDVCVCVTWHVFACKCHARLHARCSFRVSASVSSPPTRGSEWFWQPAVMERPSTSGSEKKSCLLRLRGSELTDACAECARDIADAAEAGTQFLALDNWLRAFDGEPLPALAKAAAPQTDQAGSVPEAKAAPAGAEAASPSTTTAITPTPTPGQRSGSSGSPAEPPAKKQAVQVDLPRRFAKYKRLKEALELFASRFGEDAFATLLPKILSAAAELADGSLLAAQLPEPAPAPSTLCRPPKLRSLVGSEAFAAQAVAEVEKTLPASTPAENEAAAATDHADEAVSAAAVSSPAPGAGGPASGTAAEDSPAKVRGTEEVPDVMLVKLPAGQVRALLANALLLNVRGFSDLQRLYLSSAKAAPQKILCLLAFFHLAAGHDEDETRTLSYERLLITESQLTSFLPTPIYKSAEGVCPHQPDEMAGAESAEAASARLTESVIGASTTSAAAAMAVVIDVASAADSELAGRVGADPSAEAADAQGLPEAVVETQTMGPEKMPTVHFRSDFAGALGGSSAALILLSSPGIFGAIADVKTPPEEVLLWEMPELICLKMLLGNVPLSKQEMFVVRGARRVNCCATDGPMLSWSCQSELGGAIDVAAIDVSRFVDDRRFSVEALRQDAAKWAASFRQLRQLGHATVTVTHPHMLGMDRHLVYALQLLGAEHASASSDTALTLHYSLNEDGYATGSVAAAELGASQKKEAAHFQALTGRMSRTAWHSGDLLRLLAVFPLSRARDSEKFHAFWTRRLRDAALPESGRVGAEELGRIQHRQDELWPSPPQELPASSASQLVSPVHSSSATSQEPTLEQPTVEL
ncbi:unnamed protein product [Polarella glacialis]|uniref:Uncharacterized protein n=1 Tax=Polarella glacialis TaxID=89957 RepID=A0A813F9L4_POLGL|nr:unnamed protein product [Polarella glacialis]